MTASLLLTMYSTMKMQSEALSYLSPKAEVKSSPIHGRGLFAIGEFRPGEIVCVKGGYIFTRAALGEIAPILGPAEIQIADDLFIGPRQSREREGGMIFSNHSCDPNIGVQGQIVFVALRQIAAGQELTHDWATWEATGFHCRKLAEDVYLLTYTLVQDDQRKTRRSTIWQHTPEGWKIVYHQGTIVQDSAIRLGTR